MTVKPGASTVASVVNIARPPMSFVVPNFVRPEFGTMFQKEVPLFIEITEFL